MPFPHAALAIAIALLLAQASRADDDTAGNELVEVTAFHSGFPLLGMSASTGIIGQQQLEHMPVQRTGELLESIPGLIVSQHSGEGKANQYYLRGFNLDHGTDFATYVNGVPVNLRSHAHGQGYTDLSFLMPELINSIEYRKGPYRGDDGDFSAAGSAYLHYGENSEPQLTASVGEFGYRRLFGLYMASSGHWTHTLASASTQDDGPWDLPMDLAQQQAYASSHYEDGHDEVTITAMYYHGHWNSSDQIPDRAIADGQITRFGAVDDSDGGSSQRSSLSANWQHRNAGSLLSFNAYAIDYTLQLWSDFTYFLDDPVHGDQFEQDDQRREYGVTGRWESDDKTTPLRLGFDSRLDHVAPVALYHTEKRQRLSAVRIDKLSERSDDIFIEQGWQISAAWRLQGVLREDHVTGTVNNLLSVANADDSGSAQANLFSPRMSLQYKANEKTQYFFNAGRGFHSNDLRGVLTHDNPADFLVRADSVDLGQRFNWGDIQTSLSLFQLDLDSELVFVGDAGDTDATRPSRRRGLEFALYWQLRDDLLFDISGAHTQARFRDHGTVGDNIPGAPVNTAGSGLSWQQEHWFSAIRWRHIGARALTEDNQHRTGAANIVNFDVGYQWNEQLQVELQLLNAFDSDADNIAYYYGSQLHNETAPVSDTHAHSVEPRNVRLSMRWLF